MDGSQRPLKHSLQFRLSLWLSVTIVAIAIAAGVFSFVFAFHEANELQDDQLLQMAELFNQHNLPTAGASNAANIPYNDPDSRVIVQILPQNASLLAGNNLTLPLGLPDGLQTIAIDDEAWRVFVRRLSSGDRIAVGQQTAVRDEIAKDSALNTVMPFIILAPILVLLVGMLIGHMFKPMRLLVAELDQRSEHDLSALDDQHLPSEITPFIIAINHLLARVDRSVTLQRRFVADAAHELRTPLTALSLQAERLAAVTMSAEARVLLDALSTGLQRTQSLTTQLLMLARVQEAATTATTPISLQHVFRRVLEDLMPLADAKHLDVGVNSEQDAYVLAQEMDVMTLVKNLLDNAIRYTPAGGRIDLTITIHDHEVMLQVDDTGPGIPAAECERVFDPFYRVLGNQQIGSGLGLSIVQSIVQRMKADIRLSDRADGASGLCVTVIFPRPVSPG